MTAAKVPPVEPVGAPELRQLDDEELEALYVAWDQRLAVIKAEVEWRAARAKAAA